MEVLTAEEGSDEDEEKEEEGDEGQDSNEEENRYEEEGLGKEDLGHGNLYFAE